MSTILILMWFPCLITAAATITYLDVRNRVTGGQCCRYYYHRQRYQHPNRVSLEGLAAVFYEVGNLLDRFTPPMRRPTPKDVGLSV